MKIEGYIVILYLYSVHFFFLFQRCSYRVLQGLLPPKYEFVVSVGISDLQALLYENYLDSKKNKTKKVLQDYNVLRHVWTHPLAMKLHRKKVDDPWWRNLVSEEDLEDPTKGPKLLLLFQILKYCQQIKEKV